MTASSRKTDHRVLGCVIATVSLCTIGALAVVLREGPARTADENTNGLVLTDQGPMRGVRDVNDTWVWRGVRFATAQRWEAPKAIPPHKDAFVASTFGPACLQVDGMKIVGDEDCLFLNVWRPDGNMLKPLPVIVYIHGGGFARGDGSRRQGAWLARNGPAVVVTLNYRLGIFGFLAHEGLKTQGHGTAANFGILDQAAALSWVHDNIAAFGGDPDHVLVIGASAGAAGVQALVSRETGSNFSAAALHSGNARRLATIGATGYSVETIALFAGCRSDQDRFACLRSKPASDLARIGGIRWAPVIDGDVIRENPFDVIARGDIKVPLIISHASAEYWPASLSDTAPRSLRDKFSAARDQDDYKRAAVAWIGDKADAFVSEYPLDAYLSAEHAFASAMSDYSIKCRNEVLAARSAMHGASVWLSVFEHAFADQEWFESGAFHGSDLILLFNDPPSTLSLDAREQDLSRRLARYWARFAATGDPNGGADPDWPRYEADFPTSLIIGTDARIKLGLRRTEACRFWDSLH